MIMSSVRHHRTQHMLYGVAIRAHPVAGILCIPPSKHTANPYEAGACDDATRLVLDKSHFEKLILLKAQAVLSELTVWFET
jgi:hypothetical protein